MSCAQRAARCGDFDSACAARLTTLGRVSPHNSPHFSAEPTPPARDFTPGASARGRSPGRPHCAANPAPPAYAVETALPRPDWNEVANSTVAQLRSEAGRDPYDCDLTDLVGELATRSDEFRARRAAQCAAPPNRDHALPPPRGWHHPRRLRLLDLLANSGLTPDRLQRRARLSLGRRARAARELGRHHPTPRCHGRRRPRLQLVEKLEAMAAML